MANPRVHRAQSVCAVGYGREMLEALREHGRKVSYQAGERLLHEGDPGDSVTLILAGRVKVTHTGSEGHETLLDFRGPGELVGELSALDQAPRSSSVTAIEAVEALLVPVGTFRGLLEEPGFALELLGMLSSRFRDADRKRIEFGASDSVGRAAARIAELAERYGEPSGDGTVIALPISQEELAGWTAVSRAGMASALRTLRELGWIETERRRITVRDVDALRSRARIQN
jgi:CRP/FNR family transcriptional regulator, cyclic AMP receptor protein